MTAQAALAQAITRLRAAGVADPVGDARKLLSHAMGLEPGRLTLHLQDDLDETKKTTFLQCVTMRSNRVPVSHILGGRWFYNHWFTVTPDVLDPRPDTEMLVEQALAGPFGTVLDLGLGSGCILLTLLLERPEATGIGSDISPKALEVARTNTKALGVENRLELIESDWFSTIGGQFDLIVSNPPYIAADEMADLSREVREHEPALALTPGGDELDAYRAITADIMEYLTPGGRLIVEIGPTQAAAVRELFVQAGLAEIETISDLDGRDRVVEGKKPPKSV